MQLFWLGQGPKGFWVYRYINYFFVLAAIALGTSACGKFSGAKSSIESPDFIWPFNDGETEDDIQGKPVTMRARWDGRSASDRHFTKYTLEALTTFGKDILTSEPRDMDLYCPGYAGLNIRERAAFWVMLISAMAERENGRFNPAASYSEGFANSSGATVVSRGMLQISSESSQSYDCGIRSEKDLENARKNLYCGVKIISHWLAKSNVISASKTVMRMHDPKDGKTKPFLREETQWFGPAAYWSVLRKNKSHAHIITQTNGLNICKKHY